MKIGIPFGFFEKFVLKRRAAVMARCLETMRPEKNDTCLELGGPTNSMAELPLMFKDYLAINMDTTYFKRNGNYYSTPYYFLIADARCLPMKDKSVDYIFANAFLEHVPRGDRHLVVKEMKRVCRKGFFLANDNHWFPLDPHYLVPFYQFLPHSVKRKLSRYVSFKWHPKGSYEEIDLLTISEYRRLFPGAKYEGMRFPFSPISESIIVWEKYN